MRVTSRSRLREIVTDILSVLCVLAVAWNIFVTNVPSVNMLGKAIYFEARNEPFKGRVAVAAVIFNRLKNPRWSTQYPTVVDIILAGQERGKMCDFSFACDGLPEAVPTWESTVWLTRSYAEASIILFLYHATGKYLDPTGGALTYQTLEGHDGGWFGLFRKCAEIGSHKFYCDTQPAPGQSHSPQQITAAN
jgi:spore germination cell wall hydrolase CwlJ-like protein